MACVGDEAPGRATEKLLIFDLDGTLYPAGEYTRHIRKNLFKFMHEHGMVDDLETAEAVWRPLFLRYNQSYKGLVSGGFQFDRDQYWKQHREGGELFVRRDEGLIETLRKMPFEKVIFTNCREAEAIDMLRILGVEDLFSKVYGADFLGDTCKPEEDSFTKVTDDLNASGKDMYFFEDSIKNLKTGKKFGMKTVLIEGMTATEEAKQVVKTAGITSSSQEENKSDFIDTAIPTLSDGGDALRNAFPELFLAAPSNMN